jgi:hypothetical protein
LASESSLDTAVDVSRPPQTVIAADRRLTSLPPGRDSCGRRRRRLPSLSFGATALRPESGLRSTPRGEPGGGPASHRATVPERGGRVFDPRRRPPQGSGGTSRYCQSGRTRGTRLSCALAADEAGGRAVSKADVPTRRRSGTGALCRGRSRAHHPAPARPCSPWPPPPHLDTRERRESVRAELCTDTLAEELPSWVVPRLTVERNDEVGTLFDKSREEIRVGVDLSRTSTIQRLRGPQGWTVFHLPSTRSVCEIPSTPLGHRAPPGRPASSSMTSAVPTSAGRSSSCGRTISSFALCVSMEERPRPPHVVSSCSHRRQGHVHHAVVFPVRSRPAASIRRLDPERYVSSCPSRLPAAACPRTPVALVRPKRHPVCAPESMRPTVPWLLASDRRLAFLGVCASEAATFFLDEVDTAGHDGRRGYMLGAAPATRRLARWHGWMDGRVRRPIDRTTCACSWRSCMGTLD